ncbi:MAG: tetratricopeptide repeat protein [Phycisphaerales bacterium]
MPTRLHAPLSAFLLCGAAALAGCAGSKTRPDQRDPAPTLEASSSETSTLAAEAAIVRGDRDEALRLFARAIEFNPQFTRAHMGMADLYRLEGDYAKAEQGYRVAAQTEPRNFDAQYFHGLMLHVLNRVQEAIVVYLNALRIKPDDFQTNLNISSAYYQLGENAQALPYAQTAVRLSPKDGPARLNLGTVYAELDRDREAVLEYQQAAELMPLSATLLTSLAESLGRLQRYDEMRNTLDQLVRTAPSALAHERLGFAQFKLKAVDQAAASFRTSLELDPRYYPALNGLGVCELNTYLWSENKDTAAKERGIALLRQSIMINRKQPRIEELLSRYK